MKIKSKAFGWLAILVAVAVGLTAAAVARSVGPFRDRPHVATPPATDSQQPHPASAPNPSWPPPQARPVYEGPLGDFIVGIHQGSSLIPCPKPWRLAKREKIEASELYRPIFGDLEGFVTECADGTITGIEIYGPEIVSIVYFLGKPIVPYQAPLDRLKLLTVAGKPAIAELPESPGDLSLTVIERFPKDNQPGIIVVIQGTTMSLEETIKLAVRIMGRGGSR